jgi:hypothetical protein
MIVMGHEGKAKINLPCDKQLRFGGCLLLKQKPASPA